MKMDYCMQCGTKLQMKYLESEGKEIPFCPACNAFRFPVFNTAVSMIIRHADEDRYLLIRQYGGTEYILCAGYVNIGEDAEDAARREVFEELGLKAEEIHFNRSHYFAPSNTLMLNFTVTVNDESVHSNEEIDTYSWFDEAGARNAIRRHSLAESFLLGYLDGEYHFHSNPAKPYRTDN